MEYTIGGDWQASNANSLILNFKKSKILNCPNEERYKSEAVSQFADSMVTVVKDICQQHKQPVALMSIPTSKLKTDRKYSDSLDLVGECLKQKLGDWIQIEAPIVIKESVDKSSLSKRPRNRQFVDNLKSNFLWVGFSNQPSMLVVYDDVITSGGHFAAIKEFIDENTTGPDKTQILGLFWAKSRQKPTKRGQP